MNNYRTPDEDAATRELDTRIHAVLDQATTNLTSLLVAMALDEPADVVERWVDTFWNHLRAELRDQADASETVIVEDRLRAVALLLHDRAGSAAAKLLITDGEDTCE